MKKTTYVSENKPVLAIGTWPLSGPFINNGRQMGWGQVDVTTAIKTLHRSFELGITQYDTADVYGHGRTNILIGKAFEGVPRSDYQIFLKIGYKETSDRRGLKAENLIRQIDTSLTQLKTDRIDHFSFHHTYFGPNNEDLADAIELIERLVKQGVIKSLGYRYAHEYTATSESIVRKAEVLSALRPISSHIHAKLNMLCSKTYCSYLVKEVGEKILITNKSFAQGRLWNNFGSSDLSYPLTDHRRYRSDFDRGNNTQYRNSLSKLLLSLGLCERDIPFIAMAFILAQPVRSVITCGAKTPEQVTQLIKVRDGIKNLRQYFELIKNWRRPDFVQ